jgi:hypothetical protein
MTKKEIIRRYEQANRLAKLGFTEAEAETLRRISMTLSRWAEAECNGEVEVDDDGRAFRVYQGHAPTWAASRWPIPNREAGAIRRSGKMMQDHPGFDFYHQTDPRGAALYIYRHYDLEPGQSIDSVYSSIGVCVY